MRISELEVTELEAEELATMAYNASCSYKLDTHKHLIEALPSLSVLVPARIKIFLSEFRTVAAHDVAIIRGLPVARLLGSSPTPHRHRVASDISSAPWDILHTVLAGSLGDIFAYSGQQGGHLINDIVPLPHLAEVANASAGWLYDFDFHTEDAYHPFRPDYICLLSLRNSEDVGTTVSSVRDLDLEPSEIDELSTAQYRLTPNALHESAGHQIELSAVLSGSENDRTMRVNSYTPRDELSPSAALAFNKLVEGLAKSSITLSMEPGTAIFIDNRRVAHSRKAYTPSALGSGRWLLRIVVSRDLRRYDFSKTGFHIVESI